MALRSAALIVLAALLLCSCGTTPQAESKLTVAAAANLTQVFEEVGKAFKAKTGTDVVFSYGATAQLAQQIENGAPFDVFAAADTEHIDTLVSRGKLVTGSRSVYASGQLALWIPGGETTGIKSMRDLAGPSVRFVSIAQPDLAPYGR